MSADAAARTVGASVEALIKEGVEYVVGPWRAKDPSRGCIVGDADLFNRACFKHPPLGDLYRYATEDALLQMRVRV